MKMILAYAFIQILGLAVLHDVPGEGVHVMFPNVDPDANIHQVESHTTIIAFKTGDRVGVQGWIVKPLRPVEGYSYVTLSGDQLRFIVNGKNQRAAVPAELPHLVTANCPAMQTLKAGYRQPSYPSASAVLILPEGKLAACQADAPNVKGRIDTRAALVNEGDFSVTAEGKSITFRDNALVAIANVPTAWLEGSTELLSSAAHSHVYFAMAEGASQCTLARVKNVRKCSPTAIRQALGRIPAKIVPPELPPEAFSHLTYECSNTQWP